MRLDEWQEKVLDTKGSVCLRSGRQVGKSTVISIKAGEYACKNHKKVILVIASVERQAYLLFEKILSYIYDTHKAMIKKGVNRPTKSRLRLTNGSVIYCLHTGLTGAGIRGYTIDMLIADEAAYIPDEVWTAVTPMLATTGGDIILLSTPKGKEGYFFECFDDPNYTAFHVSTPEVAAKREPIMRKLMEDNIEREKKRMTNMQFAQEYLGDFVDELRQFFPTDLIKQCMTLKRPPIILEGRYYLGIDVARMGDDASTFEVIQKRGDTYFHVDNQVTKKTLLTETTQKILALEGQYKFKRIYIDDGGLGVGVFDQLLLEPTTRRKIVAINNASRSLDRDETQKKKLMKEDLYSNLLRLMERGEIQLLDDEDIFLSLFSVQAEYTDGGQLRIFGNDTHITEGLIRAAYGAKDKTLNIWVR